MSTQGRKTDDRTRERVRRLAEQGISKSQIARQMQLDRQTVRKIVQQPPGR